MRNKMMRGIQAVAAALVLTSAAPAMAADYSFTGEFFVAKQVKFFDFTLAAPAAVTMRTYHYNGGTNAAGMTFPAGGFDPQLHVYNLSTGAFIATSDDFVSFDSGFAGLNLPAGSYRVALTKFNNDPAGANLSDGFNLNTPDAFADRTKGYALDIGNVTTATTIAPVGNGNLACAGNAILALGAPVTATQAAQLNTMRAFLNTARSSIGTQYSALTSTALKAFVSRTNGCGERGTADTISLGANEQDYVPVCSAQATIQACFAIPAP